MSTKEQRISRQKIDPKTKDVLALIGTGAFVAASVLMPGLPLVAQPFLVRKKMEEEKAWKKYNMWRLKHVLGRMQKQKLIEIIEQKDDSDDSIVRITEKGKKKILKYKLDDLQIDQKRWDGKWRLVIYDIYAKKRSERHLFHSLLKKLRFYPLQKSVYLTPFPCSDEIAYITSLYGLDTEVSVLTILGLENEKVYREYFGL